MGVAGTMEWDKSVVQKMSKLHGGAGHVHTCAVLLPSKESGNAQAHA